MISLFAALLLFGAPPSHLVSSWKKVIKKNRCGTILFYSSRLKKYGYGFNKLEKNMVKKCYDKLFPLKFSYIKSPTSQVLFKYPKNYIFTNKYMTRIPHGTWWFGWVPYMKSLGKKLHSKLDKKPSETFKFGKWQKLKSFSITVYEISKKELSSGKLGKPGKAAVNISFKRARKFCISLGGDLPNEIQWEVAARGGEYYRPWPWGESISTKCFKQKGSKCNSIKRKTDISVWGARSMGSSVWEWVKPAHSRKVKSGQAILKGGEDKSEWYWNLVASRKVVSTSLKSKNIGFRCVFPGNYNFKIKK
jgi:Sulfatase-modifying factor enzyme 1